MELNYYSFRKAVRCVKNDPHKHRDTARYEKFGWASHTFGKGRMVWVLKAIRELS